MNKLLMKKLVEEMMKEVESTNVEQEENQEKEVFFTRRNFVNKVKFVKTMEEVTENPMFNQVGIMMYALKFTEKLTNSIMNDIDIIHGTLLELDLSQATIKGFLQYLQLDIEDKTELMVDDTKYNKIWNDISERVRMKED